MLNYVKNINNLGIGLDEDLSELCSRRTESLLMTDYGTRKRIPRPYEHLCQFKLLLVRNNKFYSLNDNMIDILWGQALLSVYENPLHIEYSEKYKDFNVNSLLDKPMNITTPATLNFPKNIILGDKEKKEGTTTESVVPFFVDEENNERLSKTTKSKSKTIPKDKTPKFKSIDYSGFPATEFAKY